MALLGGGAEHAPVNVGTVLNIGVGNLLSCCRQNVLDHFLALIRQLQEKLDCCSQDLQLYVGWLLNEALQEMLIKDLLDFLDLVSVFANDPSDGSLCLWLIVLGNLLDKVFHQLFVLVRETAQNVASDLHSLLEGNRLTILNDSLNNLHSESN